MTRQCLHQTTYMGSNQEAEWPQGNDKQFFYNLELAKKQSLYSECSSKLTHRSSGTKFIISRYIKSKLQPHTIT